MPFGFLRRIGFRTDGRRVRGRAGIADRLLAAHRGPRFQICHSRGPPDPGVCGFKCRVELLDNLHQRWSFIGIAIQALEYDVLDVGFEFRQVALQNVMESR